VYDENPVRLVPQFREQERLRLISPEEWGRFRTACTEDPSLDAFIKLASLTSKRKNEILKRRYDELVLDGPAPCMYVPITKNGEPEIVPLSTEAVEAVKALPSFGHSEYLFPSTPTNAVPKPKAPWRHDIRGKFSEAAARAKISDIRPHDLRHLAASTLMMSGTPKEVISALTGHKSRALRRYLHLSPEFREQTVNRLQAVLLSRSSDTATDTVSRTAPDREREIETLREWKSGAIKDLLAKKMVGTWGLEPQTSTVSR
jgi:integrase